MKILIVFAAVALLELLPRNIVSAVDCVDENSNCPEWAATNQCHLNPGYMLFMCRKSCDMCDDCNDADHQCPGWAATGQCDLNPNYMLRFCRKSCGYCPNACLDVYWQCPEHAANGLCDDPRYINHCRLSCDRCVGTSSQCQGTDCKDCFDLDDGCPEWAARGDCVTNAGYNMYACRESCGICEVCADFDHNCESWADNGHCTGNPWATLHTCRKSCGICSDTAVIVDGSVPSGNAEAECASRGMRLFKVMDESSLFEAYRAIAEYGVMTDYTVNGGVSGGDIVFSDGSSVTADPELFHNGEPNGSGGCLHLWNYDYHYALDDVDCGSTRKYICAS